MSARQRKTGILPQLWGCLCASVLVCINPAIAQGDDRTALLPELEQIRHAHSVPVLAVATFKDHTVEFQQLLGAENQNLPLRWGSISKTFTALALSQLVEDQNLGYDNDIAQSLAFADIEKPVPWHNPWAQSSPVTFRQLSELCAGMSDLSGAEFSNNQHLPRAERLAAKPRQLRWPPGLQHSYTNVNPGLSAWVIETFSGITFEQYLTRNVLFPLGMSRASILPVPGLPGGFKADGKTAIPYWHMTFPAAGGLNASLGEMTNALSILLQNGKDPYGKRILSERVMNNLTHPACGLAARGLAVGYGAGFYGRVRQGFVFYGHGGDADGYRSRYGLLPDIGRGYLVLINTDNPGLMRQLERKLESYLIRDLTAPESPKAVVSDPAVLNQWEGTYYPSSRRFGIEAWAQGNLPTVNITSTARGLKLAFREREVQLVSLGKNSFRRMNDPLATVAFAETSHGTLMQGELGNFLRLDDRCPTWLGRICASKQAAAPRPSRPGDELR